MLSPSGGSCRRMHPCTRLSRASCAPMRHRRQRGCRSVSTSRGLRLWRSLAAAAIVTAIVIGDRAGLDESVQQLLQQAGTYHVIAISGGNIAILAALMLGAFRIAGVLGRSASLAAAAALVAYGGLVGGGASV